MTNAQVAAILIGLKPRFLAGLTPREASAVLSAANRRKFDADSVISDEGYPADHLYLLLHGGARYFTMTPQGEKIILWRIPPGEIFGGAALLSKPVDYVVSTEAVKDSSALVWDRATIRSLADTYPRLVENSLLIAYDYLILYRAGHLAAVCQTAPQRLAQVLGSLAKGIGERGAEGIELHIRNEELANEANVTIFTVSRLLGEWQRKGLLVKSRGKVVVRLPEELIRFED